MVNLIGYGKISEKSGKKVYTGTLPFSNGENVYMLKKGDLEIMLRDCFTLMDCSGRALPEEVWSMMPDSIELKINTEGVEEVKRMYFSRTMYSANFKKMFYLKYQTIENSIDTGDLDKKQGEVLHDNIEDVVVKRDLINGDEYFDGFDSYRVDDNEND